MNADTSNVNTAHGLVSRSALEDLQASYDTRALLGGVDAVDNLARSLKSEGGVRDQLLQLHAMASTVLNGAGLGGPPEVSLPDAAADLIERLGELGEVIAQLTQILAPLAGLAPINDADS